MGELALLSAATVLCALAVVVARLAARVAAVSSVDEHLDGPAHRLERRGARTASVAAELHAARAAAAELAAAVERPAEAENDPPQR